MVKNKLSKFDHLFNIGKIPPSPQKTSIIFCET